VTIRPGIIGRDFTQCLVELHHRSFDVPTSWTFEGAEDRSPASPEKLALRFGMKRRGRSLRYCGPAEMITVLPSKPQSA
jgi:hypothetical protein